MNNYEIFNILKKKDNDYLSKYSLNDQKAILNIINKYFLELRNSINLNDNSTFGLEFEYENALNKNISMALNMANFNSNYWYTKNESSLFDGGEIATPVLKDNVKTWNDIAKICTILNKNSELSGTTAGHIHIGAQTITNVDSLMNLVLLWITYENIIYRFFYGEFLNERPSIYRYAKKLSGKWLDDLYIIKKYLKNGEINLNTIIKWLIPETDKKIWAIELSNIQCLNKEDINNTIEFRCPNGTFNPVIWQNNVNFLFKLLKYTNSSTFNFNIITKRLNERPSDFDDYSYFRKININQVLEFCDLIFDNNLDKIYFLRQYVKNFEQTDKKNLIKAKNFTV